MWCISRTLCFYCDGRPHPFFSGHRLFIIMSTRNNVPSAGRDGGGRHPIVQRQKGTVVRCSHTFKQKAFLIFGRKFLGNICRQPFPHCIPAGGAVKHRIHLSRSTRNSAKQTTLLLLLLSSGCRLSAGKKKIISADSHVCFTYTHTHTGH